MLSITVMQLGEPRGCPTLKCSSWLGGKYLFSSAVFLSSGHSQLVSLTAGQGWVWGFLLCFFSHDPITISEYKTLEPGVDSYQLPSDSNNHRLVVPGSSRGKGLSWVWRYRNAALDGWRRVDTVFKWFNSDLQDIRNNSSQEKPFRTMRRAKTFSSSFTHVHTPASLVQDLRLQVPSIQLMFKGFPELRALDHFSEG